MTMRRLLIAVPYTRNHPRSIASVMQLDWDGGLDIVYIGHGDEAAAHRYDNMTTKYREAADMARRGGYDYLLTVEDDVIVPPDAALKLAALGADVAYGLIVARHEPHFWSAALTLAGSTTYDPLSNHPAQMRKLWGKVIDVAGCGLYCTLIKRSVLDALDFHRDGANGCDWDFALDCQARGFTQRMDLSVLCGHLLPDGGVLWPTPTGHQVDA